MTYEDFEELKRKYNPETDVCMTNARGFWENAPVNKALWHNVGEHKLVTKLTKGLKNDD